jgi:hypothetical protein
VKNNVGMGPAPDRVARGEKSSGELAPKSASTRESCRGGRAGTTLMDENFSWFVRSLNVRALAASRLSSRYSDITGDFDGSLPKGKERHKTIDPCLSMQQHQPKRRSCSLSTYILS